LGSFALRSITLCASNAAHLLRAALSAQTSTAGRLSCRLDFLKPLIITCHFSIFAAAGEYGDIGGGGERRQPCGLPHLRSRTVVLVLELFEWFCLSRWCFQVVRHGGQRTSWLAATTKDNGVTLPGGALAHEHHRKGGGLWRSRVNAATAALCLRGACANAPWRRPPRCSAMASEQTREGTSRHMVSRFSMRKQNNAPTCAICRLGLYAPSYTCSCAVAALAALRHALTGRTCRVFATHAYSAAVPSVNYLLRATHSSCCRDAHSRCCFRTGARLSDDLPEPSFAGLPHKLAFRRNAARASLLSFSHSTTNLG